MAEVPEVPTDAGVTKVLTRAERSQIAKEAATRRWAKVKREKAKAAKSKSASKGGKGGKSAKGKANSPREFVSALRTAEKRLVKAIQERTKAGADYAILSAEIPALTHLINALRNPTGTAYTSTAYANTAIAGISLEAIVGDQPLPYQNPPRNLPPAPASVPVPQALHPANQQGRAHGGAVGVALDETEDENQFLRESPVAAGDWH